MSRTVQDMFSSIAGGYDRANTVLSLGIHHRWRRAALRLLAPQPGDRLLDVCTGTGDVAFSLLQRLHGQGEVIGTDFCAPMLEIARKKAAERGLGEEKVRFVEADALRLPFRDASFDGAIVAFGIRNVDNPVQGLGEMRRVVRPGGHVVVLEFGQPGGPVLGPLYRFYTGRVLPALGGLVTGQRAAYEYLNRTSSVFPAGDRFLELMREAGLARPLAAPLSFGIAYAYRGEVPTGGKSHEHRT